MSFSFLPRWKFTDNVVDRIAWNFYLMGGDA
jgi:hypothetical protein